MMSSLVYTSVLLLLTISCSSMFFGSNGSVGPSNLYIFIGDNLTLSCKVTSASIKGNVSKSMYFIRTNDVIPQEHIQVTGPRSIQLSYPVTVPDEQGTYTCMLRRVNETSDMILGSQYVTVEYPVLPVEGFTCIVYNWESMNCSWVFQKNVVRPKRMKYTLLWTVRPVGGFFRCPHNTTTSCVWFKNDDTDFLIFEKYYIRVNTTVEDKYGEIKGYKEKDFEIDPHMFVKPDPIQSLKIANKSSTCLSMTWVFEPLEYASMEYIVRVERGNKKKTNVTRMDICDLHPATSYTVGVAGKQIPLLHNKSEGYLSEEVTITTTTLEDIPLGIPKVVLGGFWFYSENGSSDCSETSGSCRIRVFWQALSKEESSGEIIQYKIVLEKRYSSDGQVGCNVSGSQRSCDFSVDRNLEYKITLQAGTAVGFSSKSAVMFIPSLKQRLSFPSIFVVELKGNSLFITWSPETITENVQYTLYTCTRSWSPGMCKDEMRWIPVSNSTSHELIYSSNDGDKLIGISRDLRTDDQNLSSGIMWSNCLYQKDTFPLAPKIENVIQGENSLRVEWDAFGCSTPAVYVDKYILSYCMFKDGRCLEQVKNVTIDDQMMKKKRLDYMMEDLTPWKYYHITLRAVSWERVGPASEPKIVEVKNNNLLPGAIAGIVIAALFIIIVVVSLLLISFKFCHRKLRNVKYAVEVPKVRDDGIPDREMKKATDKYTPTFSEKCTLHTHLTDADNDTNHLIESYQDKDDQKEKERMNSPSSDKSSTNESYFKIGAPADTSGSTATTCESLSHSGTSVPETVVQVCTALPDSGYLSNIADQKQASSPCDHEPESNTETAGDAGSQAVTSPTFDREHLKAEESQPHVDMTESLPSDNRNINPDNTSHIPTISSASHLNYLPNTQILPMASTMTVSQSGYIQHPSVISSPTADNTTAPADEDFAKLAECEDMTPSDTSSHVSPSIITVSSSGYVSHPVSYCHQPDIQSQSDSHEQNAIVPDSFTSSNSLPEEKSPTNEISTPDGKVNITTSGYVRCPETIPRASHIMFDSGKIINSDKTVNNDDPVDEMVSLLSSGPSADSAISDATSFPSTDSDPVASVTKTNSCTPHVGDYVPHPVIYPCLPDANNMNSHNEGVVNSATDSADPIPQGPSEFQTETPSNRFSNFSNKDLPILSVKKLDKLHYDTEHIPLTSTTSPASDMSVSSPSLFSDASSPTQHVFLRSISSDSGIDMDFIKKPMRSRPSLTSPQEKVEDELLKQRDIIGGRGGSEVAFSPFVQEARSSIPH